MTEALGFDSPRRGNTMKLTLVVAAIAGALTIFASSASAETGMQFYNQCGTGVTGGFLNRPFCHGYVMGFFDALSATGAICHGPGVEDTQIMIVVQDWLRSHAANLQYPAHVMIRNAMVNAWPCR